MSKYILTYVQSTKTDYGCRDNIIKDKYFDSKEKAAAVMHEEWEQTAKRWEYDSDHVDEDTCECGETEAIIRQGLEEARWRIMERSLDGKFYIKPENRPMRYMRVCITRYGYAVVPGKTADEIMEKVEALKESDIDWEDFDSNVLDTAELVEECGPNGESL